MTDFCAMTRDEFAAAISDEIYRFMTEEGLTYNNAETRDRISAYLNDFGRHIETTFEPPTEAQKALRYTGRWRYRAKTAWGQQALMRMEAGPGQGMIPRSLLATKISGS